MMRRRGVMAGGVLLGLLLVGWVAVSIERVEVEVPATLKGQAAVDPLYAAVKVMRELGARAQSDPVLMLPDEGGVLLLSGWRWGMNAERALRVRQWAERGGRLVVDESVLVDATFQDWTGLKPAPWRNVPGPGRRRTGCRPVEASASAADAQPQARYSLCTPVTFGAVASSYPVVWMLGDDAGAQVVRVAMGQGSVTVINGNIFVWRRVLEGDHAALLVTAAQLRAGDAVHFLSEAEYPSILVLAWRAGAPVIVLLSLCVAAWLWRSGVRFGPLEAPLPLERRSLEEQIRGTGDFTRQYGSARPLLAASLRALEEQAGRKIPGYTRLTGDDRLRALSLATGVPATALAEALVAGGADTPLSSALATLETARRALHERRHKD